MFPRPVLLGSGILLNTKAYQFYHEPVLQHAHVRVMLSRTVTTHANPYRNVED